MTTTRNPSLAETMHRMRLHDPGLNDCWSILARGAAYLMLDSDDLDEIIHDIQERSDYINGELGLEIIGDRLRVSLLEEATFCKLDAMVGALKRLKTQFHGLPEE
jgi:hypothetical protein